MSRLPQPGGDDGQWGEILNDYLLQSHAADGSLKSDTVGTSQLQATAVTTAKLADGAVTTAKLNGLGSANGIASLDSAAKLPEAQIPTRLSASELTTTIASGVEPVVVGSLKRWHQRYADAPATAKIVFNGDSTTEYATNLFDYLRTYATKNGQPLEGMDSANIINGGNNGSSLLAWLNDANGPNTQTYSYADLVSDAPHLVVACWGINDVRLGLTSLPQMIQRLTDYVNLITAGLPGTDILLRMPNSFTTTVVGSDYVDVITHQAATDLLRQAYLSLIGVWPHVTVADLQSEVFGTTALSTSYLMQDEVHPSGSGYYATARHLASRHLAPTRDKSALGPRTRRFVRDGYIVSAGNGYIDLSAYPGNANGSAAREWPILTTDVLVVDGTGVVSLSGVTFAQPAPPAQRILKTGDWTALIGKAFQVFGDHPGEGLTEGRYQVTVDPPSIAAGATADILVTVTGVTTRYGVVVQPVTNLNAGLMMMAFISATDTVTIRLHNTTGSAIDQASSVNWFIWIVR